MIYNMVTLTVQLLLTGFLVAVIFQRFFSLPGSRMIYMDLFLAILGAFLGTTAEAWLRSWLALPLLFQIVLQFLLPALSSVAFVLLYRLANQTKD